MSKERGQGTPSRNNPDHRVEGGAASGPKPRAGAAASPGGARPDELAQIQRKLAQSEARAERAEVEQAAADEMLGKMLARVSDVETLLRVEQQRGVEIEARVQAAEARVDEGRAVAERLKIELAASRREVTTNQIAAEDARELLTQEREEAAQRKDQIARELEERETLWARISELDRIGGERDQALGRVALVEGELEAVRGELDAARRVAAERERELEEERRALEAKLAEERRALEIKLEEERRALEAKLEATTTALAAATAAQRTELEASSHAGAALAAQRLEREAERVERDAERVERTAERAELARKSERLVLVEAELAAVRLAALGSQSIAEVARDELDALRGTLGETEESRSQIEVEHIEALEELGRLRGELAEVRARHDALSIDREMREGIAARVRAEHEEEVKRLQQAHGQEAAVEAEKVRAAMEQALAEARRELAAAEEALAAARREIEAERAAALEARSLLEGEREWAAEHEADTIRKSEELDATRVKLAGAEARRVELEGSFAAAEQTIAELKKAQEAARTEAVVIRERLTEHEIEREMRDGLAEEARRQRTALEEAASESRRAKATLAAETKQLAAQLAVADERTTAQRARFSGVVEEVSRLLVDLAQRELTAAEGRAAALAGAREALALAAGEATSESITVPAAPPTQRY